MLRLISLMILLGAASAGAEPAVDPAWPTKTVHLLVAHGVGGLTDTLARDLASRLERRWGKPVVVENKPSAGGNLATEAVARAQPEGYHLLMQNSALVMGELLLGESQSHLLYRQVKPVAMIGMAPSVVVAYPQAAIGNGKDWLRLARYGEINVATCGNGKAQHFALMLLTSRHALHLRHIPYATCAQAVLGTLSGNVPSGIVSVESALPQIRAGTLIALAVTSRDRFPMLPETPTLQELGLADFDLVTWYGIFAPPSLPAELTKRLFVDVDAVVKEMSASPDTKHAVIYAVRDGQVLAGTMETDYLLFRRLSGAAQSPP